MGLLAAPTPPHPPPHPVAPTNLLCRYEAGLDIIPLLPPGDYVHVGRRVHAKGGCVSRP